MPYLDLNMLACIRSPIPTMDKGGRIIDVEGLLRNRGFSQQAIAEMKSGRCDYLLEGTSQATEIKERSSK